jgi:hypothetical protein
MENQKYFASWEETMRESENERRRAREKERERKKETKCGRGICLSPLGKIILACEINV